MQFLSDVYLRCADCDGRRFRPEVLEVRLDGRSIADVLDLTVVLGSGCRSVAGVRSTIRGRRRARQDDGYGGPSYNFV